MTRWSIIGFTVLALAIFIAYLVQKHGKEKQVRLVMQILRSLREATAVQIAEASAGEFYLPTLYPLLRNMEREGLLKAREDSSGDLSDRAGRPRILYSLTGRHEPSRSREAILSLS